MEPIETNCHSIAHHHLDVRGLLCPYPLLKTKARLATLPLHTVLHVCASDPSSAIDMRVLAGTPSYTLHQTWQTASEWHFVISKTT